MATVLLIRHAAHDRVNDTLCGRIPGFGLGDAGRAQSAALARRLAGAGVTSVRTSPVARARETAAILAEGLGLTADVDPAIEEIDFGAWAGQRFAALDGDPGWTAWNAARATARAPGGEDMAAVQARATAALTAATGTIAMVSHGDVIKAMLCGVLGLSMDHHARFHVAPASISTVETWSNGARVTGLNETVAA